MLFPVTLYAQPPLRHNDLADMPQQGSVNRDHDGRYHRKNFNLYIGQNFLEMLEMDQSEVGTPEHNYARIYITDHNGTTSLAMVDSLGRETIIFSTGEVTQDHGALTGLDDDDHPQYHLVGEIDEMILAHSNTNLSGAHSSTIDDLTDVKVVGVSQNQVLKWNGNSWVPGTAGDTTEFSFDFLTFSDNEAVTQLLGDGVWESAGNLSFSMTYDNGPPTSAYIIISGDFDGGGTSGWISEKLDITTGDKTSQVTISDTYYPDDTGDAITFTATADSLPPNDGTEVVTFHNYVYYGDYTKQHTFADADIDVFDHTSITADHTQTWTDSLGAGEYFVFAHSDDLTDLSQIRCGTGSNALTAAFDYTDATAVAPKIETVSHSNNAGNPKTEDYHVYASKAPDIDNHSTSFTTYTGNSTVSNYLRIGKDDLNTGWSNADILALTYKYASTSDEHRTSTTFDPGVSDYVVYTYPDGWGNLTVAADYENDGDSSFVFDGLTIAMSYDGTSSITNEAGFADTYRAYVSIDQNPGNGTGTMIGLSSTATYSPLYWGISNTGTTTGASEGDCEGLANNNVETTLAGIYDDYSVTASPGEYIWFCIPKRLGVEWTNYEFYDGAFPFAMGDAPYEVVGVTNYNGFSEDYYAYCSENAGLGSMTVTIQAP